MALVVCLVNNIQSVFFAFASRCVWINIFYFYAVFIRFTGTGISALTLLVRWQEGHPACKKLWWGAGVVMCLEQGADLHMAQLMPLLLTVSCFSKIQIGFTVLVPAHPGSPGKRVVKRVCVCGISALMLLVRRQERHPTCLEQGADLHMAQLMPLPLTVSCFSKIQIGSTFLVPAHPIVPDKGPLNG